LVLSAAAGFVLGVFFRARSKGKWLDRLLVPGTNTESSMIFAEFYRNACDFDGYNKARRFFDINRRLSRCGRPHRGIHHRSDGIFSRGLITRPQWTVHRAGLVDSRFSMADRLKAHGLAATGEQSVGDPSRQNRRRKPFARNRVPGMKMD
jgi:hypothetical protein